MFKFRIRMSMRKWYVRQYDMSGRHIADHGPYEPRDIASAERWATSQGWHDWDKLAA